MLGLGPGLGLGFVVAWKAPIVSDDASSMVILMLEAIVPSVFGQASVRFVLLMRDKMAVVIAYS